MVARLRADHIRPYNYAEKFPKFRDIPSYFL